MLDFNRNAKILLLCGPILLACASTAGGADQVAPAQAAQEAQAAAPAAPLSQEQAPAIEILNARYPLPGVLTGGQPTREQLADAAREGYRTIVNTRSERETAGDEEADLVKELGMRYVAIPITGSKDLTGAKVEELAEVLNDESAYPVMVHCASGNRVGALFALKAAYLDEEDAAEALALGKEAGLTRLEGVVRSLLGLPVEAVE